MLRSEILTRFEKHGILSTPQRLEIAEILLEKPQHLSADQIIEVLRDKGSKVSKATVYNSLNLFGEKGLVTECQVDPQRRFYDSTPTPHHHFYNVDTHELVDISVDAVAIDGIPELPAGTQLESAELIVRVRSSAD